MQKPEPPQALEELFGHADDCHVIVGEVALGKPAERYPIVRVVTYRDEPIGDWPDRLVFRDALDVSSNTRVFTLYDPDNFLNPLAAVEWNDGCDAFVASVQFQGMFLVEYWQPRSVHKALVLGDKVDQTKSREISCEEFKEVAEGMWERPPQPVNTMKKGTA